MVWCLGQPRKGLFELVELTGVARVGDGLPGPCKPASLVKACVVDHPAATSNALHERQLNRSGVQTKAKGKDSLHYCFK